MAPAFLLPVFMKMANRPCLVVGAGQIALEKIRILLECGAAVKVVAPEVLDEIETLAKAKNIALHRKMYSEADLEEVSIVIAATDDAELNHRVSADAVARGHLVNVVDDPAYCDFYFGSIVRRGPLQIAISTSGESPALAQQLRQEIDSALPADTGSWLKRLGDLRRQVLATCEAGPERASLLHRLARREVCDAPDCPTRALAAGKH